MARNVKTFQIESFILNTFDQSFYMLWFTKTDYIFLIWKKAGAEENEVFKKKMMISSSKRVFLVFSY